MQIRNSLEKIARNYFPQTMYENKIVSKKLLFLPDSCHGDKTPPKATVDSRKKWAGEMIRVKPCILTKRRIRKTNIFFSLPSHHFMQLSLHFPSIK